MTEPHVMVIGAARPNFMKIAPIIRAFEQNHKHIKVTLVHTGQHYDKNMSAVFFEELGIKPPEINLGIHSGTPNSQMGRIIQEMDDLLDQVPVDLIIVVGDVNATVGTATAARHKNIPVAHVEAGLRSFNNTMPEETNRILTDHLSQLLFVTEEAGLRNLIVEGIDRDKVHFTGNVMIDTLVHNQDRVTDHVRKKFGLNKGEYGVVTIHRPANVDERQELERMIKTLQQITQAIPLVFPVHVRTRRNLEKYELFDQLENIEGLHIQEPLGYYDFMGLMKDAQVVITDSGGIQEETTYLGVPCITLRTSTERPSTVDYGKNRLVPNMEDTYQHLLDILSKPHSGTIPPLWDGKAAERICMVCDQFLKETKPVLKA